MSVNDWIWLFVILAGSGGALIGAEMFLKLRPGPVYFALKPLAFKTIYAVESIALSKLQIIDGQIVGLSPAQKKAMADAAYDKWPDVIEVFGRMVPARLIKIIVSRAQWETFVDTCFGEADAFMQGAEAYLLKQLSNPQGQLPLKVDTSSASG